MIKSKFGFLKEKMAMEFPAMLFAFFILFGDSFEAVGDWSLVIPKVAGVSSIQGLLASFSRFVVLAVLLFKIIEWLFKKIDGVNLFSEENFLFGKSRIGNALNKYTTTLFKNPIRTVLVTFFILNIPYIILSYPTNINADSSYQIQQFFHITKMTAHHPICHTALMGTFLLLHKFIGWNASIFLFSLVQTFCLWLLISVIIKIAIKMNFEKKFTLALFAYYLVHPRIRIYQFYMTKDVFYSIFMAFFILAFFGFVTQKLTKRSHYAILVVSALGMMFFRNEGKYIALFSFFCCVFLKGRRKFSIVCILVLLASDFAMTRVVFPLFKIEKGSAGEMLSIPFQQTARYVKFYGDEVTAEEKTAIDAILDYENLAKNYNPLLSDPVKGTCKKPHFSKAKNEYARYFAAWLKMFLKHPGVYFEATMHNCYSYFFPVKKPSGVHSYFTQQGQQGVGGIETMESLNKSLGSDFYYPKPFYKARKLYELAREGIAALPFVSLLSTLAFYSWCAILLFFYIAHRRKKSLLVCFVPIFVQYLVLIAAPVSHCRYLFPMFFYLPILAALVLTECNNAA